MTFQLLPLSETFRKPFADMQADPAVMADLGGPFSQSKSDEKFDRYKEAWKQHGIGRWVIADEAGDFLGYCGVMRREDVAHPLGDHFEIGWRLRREAWGKGYVSRSAELALQHAWNVLSVDRIFSYTAPDNLRSQQVMVRARLKRAEALDFTAIYPDYPEGRWTGWVWTAERPKS